MFLSVSLSKGSSTSNQAFSIVFTTPSVPLVGDRNLRRKDVNRPTRCSEPLRSKVGGPSKVFAILCGMGPPDYRLIPISYMLFSEFHYLSVNNFFPKFVQSSFIPVLYNLLFFCIREFDRTLLIYVEMQIR